MRNLEQEETKPKCHLLGKQNQSVVWDRKAGSCQAGMTTGKEEKLGWCRRSRENATNWQGKKKADWKAKEQMSHFAVQEVRFLGI